MKISTKGRYGLEAIVDLALHSDQGCISIKSISSRCGISEAYILQIFMELRRAGIIDSVRGPQGGYILAMDPERITVGMVLTALEGPLVPVACLAEQKKDHCERAEACVTRIFWENIMHIVNDTANAITIGDLAKCCSQARTGEPDLEYTI